MKTYLELVKKFGAFLVPEGSLLYSQEDATGPCIEPNESTPQPHTLFR
jgi:hypothetical protein